ncbi:hypothetical protein NA57DRAFT_54317 [Rhizodiscina lignyota]|uniref:Uncharacterized protein n=1 Tax=Rhizodiscina lignyota TaxID=1504668 RepID=A0A9P4IJ23_9PEZI|nr:hypothetical protein NA57DRAFT_54317 [Rhizodiscina lignyota]
MPKRKASQRSISTKNRDASSKNKNPRKKTNQKPTAEHEVSLASLYDAELAIKDVGGLGGMAGAESYQLPGVQKYDLHPGAQLQSEYPTARQYGSYPTSQLYQSALGTWTDNTQSSVPQNAYHANTASPLELWQAENMAHQPWYCAEASSQQQDDEDTTGVEGCTEQGAYGTSQAGEHIWSNAYIAAAEDESKK